MISGSIRNISRILLAVAKLYQWVEKQFFEFLDQCEKGKNSNYIRLHLPPRETKKDHIKFLLNYTNKFFKTFCLL